GPPIPVLTIPFDGSVVRILPAKHKSERIVDLRSTDSFSVLLALDDSVVMNLRGAYRTYGCILRIANVGRDAKVAIRFRREAREITVLVEPNAEEILVTGFFHPTVEQQRVGGVQSAGFKPSNLAVVLYPDASPRLLHAMATLVSSGSDVPVTTMTLALPARS